MKAPANCRVILASAMMVAASAQVRAQSAAANLPPMPSYRQVNSAVTLHKLSPVVYFRSILGMTPAERTNALAGKPADYQKAVLGKVAEYQALPADIREARLRETQMRWDLITLMNRPPAERADLLRDLAGPERALLEDRLRQWDLLSPEMQKAFLEKESFLDFYLRWQAGSPAEQQASLASLTPLRRGQLTNELARWETLPADARQRLCSQFHQFFELNEAKQNEALTTFTDADRQAMETALRRFAGLSDAQRQACIVSFQKFATMDPDERNQFLKNADRWEAMTFDERSLWSRLVQKYPVLPPMPPGMGSPRLPPMPPGMKLQGMNEPPSPPGEAAPAKLAGAKN